jgi:hypothetical protein
MTMSHRLLIDNWTLQNAGEILCNGLSGESAHELVFTKTGVNYRYDEVPADIVRFEALCLFLSNIVFSDEIFLDGKYADAWERFEPIKEALAARIIVKKPFKDLLPDWINAREAMADRLCLNAALLKAHRANKRAYAKDGKSKDEYLSQLLWGGAGMLARAEYFNLPYVPHPARAQLFRRVGIILGSPTAGAKMAEFVSSERSKIYKRLGGGGVTAEIHLPPIVVQIIESSRDVSDLVPTALQLRDDYTGVRVWLAKLQQAFSEDNTKAILAHNKELESVSQHLDSYSSSNPQGDTTIQVGVSWLKVGVKAGAPLNTIKNRFGIRAQLNRLILAPAGFKSVKKFTKMLGEQHTTRGRVLTDSIVRRLSEDR